MWRMHLVSSPVQKISNLTISPAQAVSKMTHFNHRQLHPLYNVFDLEGKLKPMHESWPFLPGTFCNGHPYIYRIHPEEVSLFTLCKVATGMRQVQIVNTCFGGDKIRWLHVYPWMLKYLNERYNRVIGHQGLAHFP
jgi:hypothetical protein